MGVINKLLYNIHEKVKGRDVLSKLDELERNQWLSLEQINEIQNKKLLNIINISIKDVPYYKKIKDELKIDINNINVKDTIRQFPILTKDDIIRNYDNLVNSNIEEKVYRNSSGGSTGMPVKLLQDQIRNDYNAAGTMRSDRWANFDFNSSVFQFWGASRDIGSNYKEKIRRLLFKRYIFNAFNWNEDIIVEIHKLMGKVKPDVILAYSSALYFYVKTSKEKGLEPNHIPKGIITSADMLYDYQRDEIEEYFSTKVFNRYGCREVGLIACECEEHEGLHISSDRLYVEVVDEYNNPIPDGKIGKILITDLTNTAMPLLRYEIGDMGKISKNKECYCGRNLPKLESIEGRITEYIITKDGKYINGAALTTLVPKLNNIKQLQLVQTSYDSINVRVVKNNLYSVKDEIDMMNKLKEYIDYNIDYKFKYVDSLINEKSGKYSFIINKLR